MPVCAFSRENHDEPCITTAAAAAAASLVEDAAAASQLVIKPAATAAGRQNDRNIYRYPVHYLC